MASVKIVKYKECIDLHKEHYPRVMFSMRVTPALTNYLEGLNRFEHFGNPFKTDDNAARLNTKYKTDKYKGYGSIEDVCKAYIEWVKGNNYQNTSPRRRAWIMDKVLTGELDDVEFVYYRDDSKNNSHIRELVNYINERKAQKDTTDD